MPSHTANGKPGSEPKLALFRGSILLCTERSCSWAMSTPSMLPHRWWRMRASGRGFGVRPHSPLFRNLPLSHLSCPLPFEEITPHLALKWCENLRFVSFSSEWKELWPMSWKKTRTPRTLGQSGLRKQGGRKGLRGPPPQRNLDWSCWPNQSGGSCGSASQNFVRIYVMKHKLMELLRHIWIVCLLKHCIAADSH